MKIYIYQDEKSHKFWAVEQQGNELHISWGKVGTNGQSQVKSFADAAAAEKAELKLIAEKVKKGYEEEQETTAASEISPAEIPLVTEARSALNAVTILPVTNAAAPWLADNAPIISPKHIARYALSHRRWPGEPIALPTQPEKKNLISRMANSVSGFCKNLTFDYSSCPFEWSEAIAQAFSFINTPKPVIS
ncbi:WGR domain-containing protein, partial [Escherichia albertii]